MERIEEAYGRFGVAFEARDLAAIGGVLDDGFTWILQNGDVLDRETSLREIGAFLAGTEGSLSFRAEIKDVVPDGEALVVTAVEEVTREDGSGPAQLLSRETVSETWVLVADRWRLRTTRVLSSG